MFHSLFVFRRLLATTFLVVFVNVFVGQCWCAAMVSSKAPAGAKSTRAATKPVHAGCHGHKKAVTAKGPTSQKHSANHECCKDKSASVLASMAAPSHKHLFVPAPALLPTPLEVTFRPAAGRWNRNGAVVLVPRKHLPPKIPDIRIFIQSLTV